MLNTLGQCLSLAAAFLYVFSPCLSYVTILTAEWESGRKKGMTVDSDQVPIYRGTPVPQGLYPQHRVPMPRSPHHVGYDHLLSAGEPEEGQG